MQSQTLPVFVINLARSADRMAEVRASAPDAGVTLIRVDAVDGRTVPAGDWVDVDVPEFHRQNGRKLLPGEYGCYRSHILALETFCETGEPYGVIIEDDVLLDARFPGRVRSIIEAYPELDVVKLVNHRAVGFIHHVSTAEGDDLGRTAFGPQGSAAAYLVSRDAAQRLVVALRTMQLPRDVALERYWSSGINLLTVQSNVLEFSSFRSQTNISVDHENTKFPKWRRLPTAYARTCDHIGRFFHALTGPEGRPVTPFQPAGGHYGRHSAAALIAGIAILLFISPIWWESDLYRFVGLALVSWALVIYYAKDAASGNRILIGYGGLLCLAWALYAAARFGLDLMLHPENGAGSAEGIFMLSIAYPTFGYALWRFCRYPFAVVVAVVVISLGALIASTDYAALSEGVLATTFAHNNTIHAANASGFMLIFAVCFADHLFARPDLGGKIRPVLLVVAAATGALAFINILGLESKGVWLALAVALPVLILGMVFRDWRQASKISGRTIFLVLVLVLGVGIGISQFGHALLNKAGGTTLVALTMLDKVLHGQGLLAVMNEMSSSPDVPGSAQQRLILWTNAASIWLESPWFGAGIGWRSIWQERQASFGLGYDIFHNGYIEILVRYGLFGLAAYAAMLGFAVRKVYLAARLKLVGASAFNCYLTALVYFLVSNLSNSNIRLAIGESYLWFAVGFGFYCAYLLQENGIERPKTLI
ncbi:O-antigen ligase family protein [Hoeflea ulvae]|uniref:Glycosyltransferase family 25 protein n=1 Tax=Hoeflea ulvae TaxID=2983764 RepID=A0ABT3YAS3_9HYPH|nr:O-antigen ligase family protein [Hoeflea ulvae]MCY0092980.1 glycosyltransferase family 25 protein [Hoeflea ulvae]